MWPLAVKARWTCWQSKEVLRTSDEVQICSAVLASLVWHSFRVRNLMPLRGSHYFGRRLLRALGQTLSFVQRSASFSVQMYVKLKWELTREVNTADKRLPAKLPMSSNCTIFTCVYSSGWVGHCSGDSGYLPLGAVEEAAFYDCDVWQCHTTENRSWSHSKSNDRLPAHRSTLKRFAGLQICLDSSRRR